MSYILEALKKSEQQREIGRVPGISSVHENTSKSVSRKWLWVLVSVLLVNAALLLLVLIWPEREPDRLADARDPVQAPQEGHAVAEAAAQLDQSPNQPPPATEIASPARVAEPPAIGSAETGTVPRREALEERIDAMAPPPAQPQAVLMPRPMPVVKVEAPPLPVWPQIPSNLLQQMNGSLRLDVHVFSDRPDERFVLINMQKYREDEELQEGPRLDEITPEGVILSFRGQRFRLQAQ